MRKKYCEVVSNVEHLKVDIQEVIRSKKSIKQWAYILHDKDDIAPHYHIYLNFGNNTMELADVANWFGVPCSCIFSLRCKKTDVLRYMINSKHKSSSGDVVSNFDIINEISASM